MLECVSEVVTAAEQDPEVQTRAEAFRRLRKLGLDDFGAVLWSMPDPRFPKLSGLLPAMASEEVQRNWTGNTGLTLLRLSAGFVRSLSYNVARLCGRPLDDQRILDFGCGYGRIARLMYYFVGEERLFGVDPWDRSIELCREAGLGTNFLVSDYLPRSLPIDDVRFDLVYAFSVFTHLSQRATVAALSTVREYVAPGGLLCITIRPIEYWHHDPHTTPVQRQQLMERHRTQGFAFSPHNLAPVDGDVTYGDASMTLDWLEIRFPCWELVATDRSMDDDYQRYVFLRAR